MRLLIGWCIALMSSAILGVGLYQVVLSAPQPHAIALPADGAALRTPEPIPTPTITRTKVRVILEPTPTVTVQDLVAVKVPAAQRSVAPAPRGTGAPKIRRRTAPSAQVTREEPRAKVRSRSPEHREDSDEAEGEAAKRDAERAEEAAEQDAERAQEAAKQDAERAGGQAGRGTCGGGSQAGRGRRRGLTDPTTRVRLRHDGAACGLWTSSPHSGDD